MSKILILSDIHFCKNGSSVQSYESIRSLWVGFDTLILNGDTAETLSSTLADPSIQLTESLVDAATEDGLQVILLGGNHDPDISNCDHVYLLNEKILVFHGHVAFQGVAPWSWRSPHIQQLRKDHIRSRGDGFMAQLEAVRAASSSVRMKVFEKNRPSYFGLLMFAIPSMFQVLRGWVVFPSLISDWVNAYSPQSSVIITGHTHRPGIWKRGNKTIINTGCFGLRGFPARPKAVVVEGQQISLFTLQKRGGAYGLGRQDLSFELK